MQLFDCRGNTYMNSNSRRQDLFLVHASCLSCAAPKPRRAPCLLRAARRRGCRLTLTSVKSCAKRRRAPSNGAWLGGTTTRRSASPSWTRGTRAAKSHESSSVRGRQADDQPARSRPQVPNGSTRDAKPPSPGIYRRDGVSRVESICVPCGMGDCTTVFGSVCRHGLRVGSSSNNNTQARAISSFCAAQLHSSVQGRLSRIGCLDPT